MRFKHLANALLSLTILLMTLVPFLVLIVPVNIAPLYLMPMDSFDLAAPYDYVVQGQYGSTDIIQDNLGIKDYNEYLKQQNAVTELPEVVIAVIDSGINMQHPLFNGTDRVITQYAKNFNEDAGDSTVWNEDKSGHGSHVAGIIVDSTLPNVKILPIKVFQGIPDEKISGIDEALEYVLYVKKTYGLNIIAINMSLGTDPINPWSDRTGYYATKNHYQNYIDDLVAADILPIIAAGNGGSSYPSFPAACDGALAVSSYNHITNGFSRSFSNYGNHISLSAPGENIVSAIGTHKEAGIQGDYVELTTEEMQGTAVKSGTSMATPFVAACYAMVVSDTVKTTAEDFGVNWDASKDTQAPYYYVNPQHKALLLWSADLGQTGNDEFFGYGVVDVSAFAADTIIEPDKEDKPEDEILTTDDYPTQTTEPAEPLDENFLIITAIIIGTIILIYAFQPSNKGGEYGDSQNTGFGQAG